MSAPLPSRTRPVTRASGHGTPTTAWAERATVRRELLHDGYQAFLTRAGLAAVLLVSLIACDVRYPLAYIALVLPFGAALAEIVSHADLNRKKPARTGLISAISGTTRAGWERARFVNATGQVSLLAVLVLGLGVLPFAFPTSGPTWAVIAGWTAVVLYVASGTRSVLYDSPFNRPAATVRRQWVRIVVRRAAGPVIAVGMLVILGAMHLLRGPWPPDVLPALVVASALPVLLAGETRMVDRTLRAADEEHRETATALRRSLVRAARETAAPVAASARRALRDVAGTGLTVESLANLPLLLDTLADEPAGQRGGLAPATVVAALRSVATYSGLPVVLEVTTDELTLGELDTCLRVVRRTAEVLVSDGVAERPTRVVVQASGTLRLTVISPVRDRSTRARALRDALDPLVRLLDGRLETAPLDDPPTEGAGDLTMVVDLPLPRRTDA